MADYWKSQPKKLCEFCKCWITDNKASIEFHERGKKHKENVQKRIAEVQKKSKETANERKQLEMDLAAIEAAALKAYEKDLNIEGTENRSNPSSTTQKMAPETKMHSKGETTPECLISYEGIRPVLQCLHGWNIGTAPEGHYYYYNTTTQVSQWEPPSCISSASGSDQDLRHSEDSKVSTDVQDKTSEKEDIVESEDSLTNDKRAKNSPYGQWTTVQTFTPISEIEVAKSTKESESKSTEIPEQVKFKERATPKIVFRSASDGGAEVTFKKRKLNPQKKRNVRQTDPNKVD